MAYTWERPALELLRAFVGDIDETPIYDNDKLVKLLVVAAFQVNKETTFSQTFTVDLVAQTISPDPTDDDTKDDNFVNLMCLKAACIMDRGNAVLAAGKAVSGRDMNAVQFDLTGVAQSTLALLKEGWCKVYSEVLSNYLSGDGGFGRAVVSPFRILPKY